MLELMNAHQLAAFGEADHRRRSAHVADVARRWRSSATSACSSGTASSSGTRTSTPTRDGSAALVVRRQGRPRRRRRRVVAELVAWLDERARDGRLRVWTSDDRCARSLAPSTARLRARPALLPDGDRPRRRRARARLAGRDLGSHARRGRPSDASTTRSSRSGRTPRPARRDLRGVGALADSSASRSTRALVPRVRRRRARRLPICRQDSVDPTRGLRRDARCAASPGGAQGLGEALLLHSFQEFSRRGCTRGTLGVDASSPTGATRLYERAGMTRLPGYGLPRAARAG